MVIERSANLSDEVTEVWSSVRAEEERVEQAGCSISLYRFLIISSYM